MPTNHFEHIYSTVKHDGGRIMLEMCFFLTEEESDVKGRCVELNAGQTGSTYHIK